MYGSSALDKVKARDLPSSLVLRTLGDFMALFRFSMVFLWVICALYALLKGLLEIMLLLFHIYFLVGVSNKS